jgi:phosphate/sulfate permease
MLPMNKITHDAITVLVRIVSIGSLILAIAILFGAPFSREHLPVCAIAILLWLASEYSWKKERDKRD